MKTAKQWITEQAATKNADELIKDLENFIQEIQRDAILHCESIIRHDKLDYWTKLDTMHKLYCSTFKPNDD